MKTILKFLFLITLLTAPVVAKSQTFSLEELASLSLNSYDDMKQYIENKGYAYEGVTENAMSKDYIFKAQNGMKMSLVIPNFETDEKLFSWDFSVANYLYQDIDRQLRTGGYKNSAIERRNKGKYISKTYTKPGITVILSKDKTTDKSGVYQLSFRSVNPLTYIQK